MNLIKYYPRYGHNRVGNFLDDFFSKSISDVVGSDFTMNLPAINVVEKTDSFILELAAPGLQKEDFEVKVEGNKLVLSAEVSGNQKETGDHFTRREFNYQSFKRRFSLPDEILKEAISATYDNGVLAVILPKADDKPVREEKNRIEVS